MDKIPTNSSLLLYQTEDGQTKIEVRLQNETVWLSQAQLCELFDRDKRTISEHIQNIFKEGELFEGSVIRKFRTTASDGKNYQINYYNLDVIISVGYRVSSHRGTQFRIWATQRLREYLIKGFTLDDFLRMTSRDILSHAGKISHEEALDKARIEYSKYQQQSLATPSLVEQHFLESIKEFERAALINASDN